MKLSQEVVKRSLASHSWLGVMISALMYLVCLSGSILVFHAELEQWEQADAPIIEDFDVVAAEQTFNEFLARGRGVTPHMYLVLPTQDSPYARIATEDKSWFLTETGELGIAEKNVWSTLLLDLHLYLHLPQSWGMIFVSVLGAVLIGLIISGFLAHPSIFRDAFRLRQKSSDQLTQTDLHNRLSVWGAPFHLTIAITGAYFGLSIPLLAIVAEAEFDGDRDRVVSIVFGEEPQTNASTESIEINRALEHLARLDPLAEPFNVIVHDAESDSPLLEVYARHPQRLIWGEAYQFEIDGTYLQKSGWSDGSIGKQVLYSIYRAHFGTFDGLLGKLLYLAFGLALTVVAASGANIWLRKRRKDDGLTDLWNGIVWGTPIALVVSALWSLIFPAAVVAVFWLSLLASLLVALAIRNVESSRYALRLTLIALLIGLVVVHAILFGWAAADSGALLVNTGIVVAVIVIAGITFTGRTAVSRM